MNCLEELPLMTANLLEIIPISFIVKGQLQEHYHHYTKKLKVQTISGAKHAGVTVDNIFGKDKALFSEFYPDHQARTRQN